MRKTIALVLCLIGFAAAAAPASAASNSSDGARTKICKYC